MKLDVLASNPAQSQSWYADGLRFTCSQCGNCCTGGPGYVWISDDEIVRLAEFLKLTAEETIDKYCRKIHGRFSLRETRRDGLYDCIFLKEVPAESSSNGDQVVHTRRVCSVYPVRPLQCRTWPFWAENLDSEQDWQRAGRKCPGIGQGRKFTLKQIHAIRDAADWPERPPTS